MCWNTSMKAASSFVSSEIFLEGPNLKLLKSYSYFWRRSRTVPATMPFSFHPFYLFSASICATSWVCCSRGPMSMPRIWVKASIHWSMLSLWNREGLKQT